jgi:hypothetical protein
MQDIDCPVHTDCSVRHESYIGGARRYNCNIATLKHHSHVASVDGFRVGYQRC